MPDVPARSVTLYVSTWKQPACLSQQLVLWRSCPLVHTVRVNHFEGDGTVAAAKASTAAGDAPVIFDSKPNELTQRFAPPPGGFATEAVFSVDVDTFYTCAALGAALRIWRSAPDRRAAVVGFSPRNLTRPRCANDSRLRRLGLRSSATSARRGGATMRCTPEQWDLSYSAPYAHNTVFVTKGAIVHREVFDLFSAPEYAAQRKRCDDALTGEDYLMSFVLARAFGAALHVTPLFTPPYEMCDIDCELAKVSLGVRSSARRPPLLRALFDELGDPFRSHARQPPVFMSLGERCDRRCHEERHARVTYLTSDGTQRILTNNYRTFCRNCPPELRPTGQGCPDAADGWTVEVPAVRKLGRWTVSERDLVTPAQRDLVARAGVQLVRGPQMGVHDMAKSNT